VKRYGYVVLAAIAVLLVSLFVSTSAQAYPDARIALTVNHQVIYAGDSFRATGSTNIACSLDLEWNDVVRHSGPTKEFQTSFVAPTVTAVTSIPLTGVCRLAGTTAGKAGAPTTVKRSLDVTVLPRASGSAAAPAGNNSADLPGTGGPNRIVLLSGLVLLLAGATAVTVARRRAEEVELPGQTA
jgi:hypothetical protein